MGNLNWWELQCCIQGGDLNVTRFLSEKSGVSHISPAMREFFNFITEHEPMYFPLIGGMFTWLNDREHALVKD